MRLITVIALIAAAAMAFLYYAWLRDSSLVKVHDVTVTGLTGPDAGRVRQRLEEAGLDMTTLHVSEAHLRQAVASEPSIESLRATPDFPHGLRIDVTENHPVAAVVIPGSGRVPLAGNGTLMPGRSSAGSVPDLKIPGSVKTSRRGGAAARVADDRAAPLIRIAATAPPALLQRAAGIGRAKGDGIVVVLRDGPRVIFGDDTRLADKWRAAAGVLASPDAQGAAYVDVRMPDRPVAGGLKTPVSTDGATAAPGASTTPAAPATPSTPTGGSPQATAPPAPTTPAPVQPSAPQTGPQTPPTNTQP